ncbi:hypothetical protein LCGC14_0832890 [marine sediment metagenome]|uniref:Uncharacterized protein n=1 Tax=marine sediment metagenome TaxID=412755 RepID=A0A0F9S058_9ZZZZ
MSNEKSPSNPGRLVGEVIILVNGHSIQEGKIFNTVSMLSHSRTFKLKDVNQIDVVLPDDETDDILADYAISVPL